MARSMTGSGEGRVLENGFDIYVYIKSINHRYLNINIRLSREYQSLEPVIREYLSSKLSRGKVDVSIEFYSVPDDVEDIVINRGYGNKLANCIIQLAEELNVPHGLTAEKLVRYPDIISKPLSELCNAEPLKVVLVKACDQALNGLIHSRTSEGLKMAEDMKTRLEHLSTLIDTIKTHADKQPGMIKGKLESALLKMNTGAAVDPDRLKDEVMLLSVRSDITEEIVRFSCHLERITAAVDSESPVGKEMEFLLQELHREITTIGSKSAVTEINQLVVPVKMEIEKLREQVQNLE